MANAYAALECGITDFDTSLGAMGGCPVIPNAKGNIATEDFVNLLISWASQTTWIWINASLHLLQ